MEEHFKIQNYYSIYGDEVVHYDNIKADIGYLLEVDSKLGFDQRQVLQVRSAIKKFEETIEAIVEQRVQQVKVTDLAKKG